LFAIAAASDVLDGYLAKNFGWTSEVGKVLDPLADKLLLVSVFITLAAIGLCPSGSPSPRCFATS
jgi:cardiolipin synthase